MVYSVSCFTIVIATLNTFVNLSNGETALVTHIGTVKILEKLILINVLCVSSFSFNLHLVLIFFQSVNWLKPFFVVSFSLTICASSWTLLIGVQFV